MDVIYKDRTALTDDMYYWVESAYEEWEAESEAIHQRD